MYTNYSAQPQQTPYGVYNTPYGYPQQNMWNQQPYYNPQQPVYGYPVGSGVIINPCNVKGISTTSKEDDEILKNAGTKEFQITGVDIARSKCNHKDQEGNLKIECIDDTTNKFRCTKCGETFKLIKPSQEAVEELVEMVLDLFQSIKTSWLSPPKEFAENVYTIQCLIKQLPEMYKAAMRDWDNSKKAISNQVQPAYAGYYGSPFNSVPPVIQQGFYGNPYAAPAPMQPPMSGYQQMQPGQPIVNNNYYSQPMPVGGNMTSEFVQGGVVPVQPQQNVPISQAVPFAKPNIPQPGQPINNINNTATVPNPLPNPNQQQNAAVTTTSVNL